MQTEIMFPNTKKDTPYTNTTTQQRQVHQSWYTIKIIIEYTKMKIETKFYDAINTQSRKQCVKTRFIWVTSNFLNGLLNNDWKISSYK